MGSAGSVEMKIPVSENLEPDKNGKRLIKKHNSQPQNVVPGAKTRQRAMGVRTSQSLYSVDVPATQLNQGLESARKENELKLTKEQDTQALMRKVQKLEDENSRLRVELQALNRLCQKLRVERQTAIETCNDANQRAIALDQDREKIQRQFKIFRETKESEIQVLLQGKRDLESKLHRLQAHGFATSNDLEFQSSHDVSKTRNAVSHAPPLNQWWDRPESDTTSLFGSFTHIRNAAVPESNTSIVELKNFEDTMPQTSNNDWHISNSNYLENGSMLLDYSDSEYTNSCQLRCLVIGTTDCAAIIENFMIAEKVQNLKEFCLEEGTFLSLLSLAEPYENDYPLDDILKYAAEISDVTFCFIGYEDNGNTELSSNLLQAQSHSNKSVVYFLSDDNKLKPNTQCSFIRQDIENNRKYRRFYAHEQAIDLSVMELLRIVKVELGINFDKDDEGEVSCVEDIVIDERIQQEQREIGSTKYVEAKPVGLEPYYTRLDDFVSSPSPTPPMLVSGENGSGKTTLLKSWLDQLKKSQQNFVIFQHFVSTSNSLTSEPVHVMRRLLNQVSRHMPPYLLPPPYVLSTYDPVSLVGYLSIWLERLSSISSKHIVIVIDAIDDIYDYKKHFKWLLDPLPVSVRVILSIGDECPSAWKQWKCLHLKPLSSQNVNAILSELYGSKGSLYRQFRDEIITNCQLDRARPLHVVLLLKVLCAEFVTDRKSLMHDCLRAQDCNELYQVILNYVELQSQKFNCHDSVVLIFQFIYISRNGLSEDEVLNIPVLSVLDTKSWLRIRHMLTYFCILTERAGFLQFVNSTIRSNIGELYVDKKISKSKSHMLIKLFTKVYSPSTPRSAEMLSWLYFKLRRQNDLQNCLLHPIIFHHLYTSGKGSDIIQYWRSITDDKTNIVEHYQKLIHNIRDVNALRKANALFNAKLDDGIGNLMVSNVYESVGRFFRDLNVMEIAVTCLERSMEIRETELNGDHHLVADCLHYLGSVYVRWKKYAMAEPLLRQALELVECVVGQEHPRVTQELQSLCFVARKLERHEDADSITRKIATLQERYGALSLSMSRFLRLRKQEAKLEELAQEEGTISVANAMNSLGVYCLAQKKIKSASSFFEKSLALKRKLLGEHHAEVAQCLQYLAAVLSEEKQYRMAFEHMKQSLEIRKIVFGEHNPSVLTTTKNLAILAKKSKDVEQARKIYQDLLKLSEEMHGSKTVATATAMVNLAVVESQLGYYESALPLYEAASEIFETHLGPTCKEVADTYRNIAILRYNKKEFTEAAALYKKSMAIREQLKSRHGNRK